MIIKSTLFRIVLLEVFILYFHLPRLNFMVAPFCPLQLLPLICTPGGPSLIIKLIMVFAVLNSASSHNFTAARARMNHKPDSADSP